MTVLVVEDDPAHQLLIRRALTQPDSPFSVVQLAETSSEAIDFATQMAFDVLLVDNRIPGHRGLDLVDLLRGRGIDSPFVLMTSAGSEDLAVQAYRKQVAEYVVKEPAFWNDLPHILSRVVAEAREAQQANRVNERLQRTTGKLQQLNSELQAQNQQLALVKAELALRDEEVLKLRELVEKLSGS